ncbi:metallophosphoesterase [Acidobacteria bacterium ACD]|nr:metallophosphoesterase [Acidobacteria bacterium ACD]
MRWGVLLVLFLSYPVGRVLSRDLPGPFSSSVEMVGAVWMGFLFLGTVAFLSADLLTGFGKLWPSAAVPARTAALVVALALSAVAVVQGLRPPRVVPHEVVLPGLPEERDGLRVVQLTDLHLGSLLGPRWLSRRLDQVASLAPDLLVVTGDLVDSENGSVEPLVPLLSRLSAPLGVWGVSGNHEFYAGLEKSLALYRRAGIRVLSDEWKEVVPGLVLAGVDDLTARRQFGRREDPLPKALAGAPATAAKVLLSHSPMKVEEAASLGVGLMLSGHTHGGQIWPFSYLSAIPYPRNVGRFEVGTMTLLVSRGTGTWGPPMRLFRRSEILVVTLRAGGAASRT